jgi:DnaJ like chaperone protein
MSIWGKLVGAAAGMAIGGPIGALVGAFAGHLTFDRSRGQGKSEAAEPEEDVAFTIGVIALGAKMAKADGVVTKDEIDAFKDVFIIAPEDMSSVSKVFNLAKRDVAGYDAYARQLASLFKDKPEALEDVMDGLFHIAKADNVVADSELEYLRSVADIFGFSADDFGRIQARHMEPEKTDPYVVLGLERSATDDEIKRSYRRLVRDNHPDKLIARGVPAEAVEIANRKVAAINAAYDQIEKERGL